MAERSEVIYKLSEPIRETGRRYRHSSRSEV